MASGYSCLAGYPFLFGARSAMPFVLCSFDLSAIPSTEKEPPERVFMNEARKFVGCCCFPFPAPS
jgi:hypothetical protein